jgi:hypothetical protein
MPQAFSNAADVAELVVAEATVAKRIRNIFGKLNLPESFDRTSARGPHLPTRRQPGSRLFSQ